MKKRPIIILGIVAFIGAIVLTLLVSTEVTTVPIDQFTDTLHKRHEIRILGEGILPPERLSLALRIRFLMQNFNGTTVKGDTGFSDCSQLYLLNSGSGNIECTAHIRGNNVYHVTLEGGDGVDAMRAMIQDLFPGLPVD